MTEKLKILIAKTAELRAPLVATWSESSGPLEILLEGLLEQVSAVEQKLNRIIRSMPDDDGNKSSS